MCNVYAEFIGSYGREKDSEGVRLRFVLQDKYYVQYEHRDGIPECHNQCTEYRK